LFKHLQTMLVSIILVNKTLLWSFWALSLRFWWFFCVLWFSRIQKWLLKEGKE